MGRRRKLRFVATKEALSFNELDSGVPRLDMLSPKDESEGVKMRKRGLPFVALKVPIFVSLARQWSLEYLHGARNSFEHVVVQRYKGDGFTFCGSFDGVGCDHNRSTKPLNELIESMHDAGEEERRTYAAYESEAAAAAYRKAAESCAAFCNLEEANVDKVLCRALSVQTPHVCWRLLDNRSL